MAHLLTNPVNKKRLFVWLGCVILMSTLFVSANAQKFWQTKPYTEWSPNEVQQILLNSPWAQTNLEKVTVGTTLNSYVAVIRLRSALPIRQALLRQKQIQLNYAKFTATDKARFDSETREFLECKDCTRNYIVTIRSPSSPAISANSVSVDVIGMLENLSLADVKPYVRLVNDSGDQRELVHFVPPKEPGGEAMFVFPRFDANGKALVSTANKKFQFKVDEKLFEKRSVPMKSFTFEVARLTLNGEVVF